MGIKDNTSCPQPWVLYTAQNSFHSPSSFNQTSEDKLEVLSSCRPYLALCSLQCQFLTFFGLLRLFHWHFFTHFFSFAPPLLTCLRVVLTFPLFISSTGTTICGWPWPHSVVPQAQTHVIIIHRNIRRVGKKRRKRTVRTAATPVSH